MNTEVITVLTGVENMDFDRVTTMLSQAYWSKGIKIDEIKQGAYGSALVVGAFVDGYQIGYARAISDTTRFAYVSDVYVDEAYRKMGAAKKMMNCMMAHPLMKDVYQWLLKSEADELYEKLGFTPVSDANKWLEIKHQRPIR